MAPRRLLTLGLLGAMPTAVLGTSVLVSAFTDRGWEAHWKQSTPVLLEKPTWGGKFRQKVYMPLMRTQEHECLSAWLEVLALNPSSPPPRSAAQEMAHISPSLVTHDNLLVLVNLSELQAARRLLRLFVNAEPCLLSVHREMQGKLTLLQCKTENTLTGRLPFMKRRFQLGTLRSSSSLVLQPSHQSLWRRLQFWRRQQLEVTMAEHHWFGGRIWSSQTGSVSSPWGDIGDISRRSMGYLFALLSGTSSN